MKVLVTGAGAPGGPGIIKALGLDPKLEVIVCDADEFASGRFLGFPFIKIPKADDVDFLDNIIEICISHSIRLIFPLVTLELFKFADAKEQLNLLGIRVLVSEKKYLDIANNKRKLLDYLKNSNIPVPDYRVVRTILELKTACAELNYPKESVVLKPSVSNGSRGVRILTESVSEFDLLFNEKPGNLFSSLDKIDRIISSKPFPELIISEFLPGDEFTVDTIVKDGKVKLILPRRRVKMSNGISVAGKFEKNLDIIDYCTRIIESMHLDGPIGVQVKADSDGRFKVLEINPRIQGTSVAALGAGVNLPVMAIYRAMDWPIADFNIKWGVNFVRFYDELFYDNEC
jgi:carbamoyl-phosphate synthase large subunit